MGTFDNIRKSQPPLPNIEGFIWINMLVKYDTKGSAQIIASYTNPAKESTIKRYQKPKDTKTKEVFKVEKTEEKKSLFK